MNGTRREFASYYKDGYSAPFAQFVLVEDTKHRPRPEEAAVAWEFLRHFSRDENGKLVELTGWNEVWHWRAAAERCRFYRDGFWTE